MQKKNKQGQKTLANKCILVDKNTELEDSLFVVP